MFCCDAKKMDSPYLLFSSTGRFILSTNALCRRARNWQMNPPRKYKNDLKLSFYCLYLVDTFAWANKKGQNQ